MTTNLLSLHSIIHLDIHHQNIYIPKTKDKQQQIQIYVPINVDNYKSNTVAEINKLKIKYQTAHIQKLYSKDVLDKLSFEHIMIIKNATNLLEYLVKSERPWATLQQ